MKKKMLILSLCMLMLLVSGCKNVQSYEEFEIPKVSESTLSPVDSIYLENNYENVPSTIQPTLKTVSSEDGLCVIEIKESYFEITLDYEKGTHREVGSAYGETIYEAFPEYADVMELYLYENIKLAFPNLEGDYRPVLDRLNILKSSLREEYQEEMEGYATAVSNGEKGFSENGVLSYEEAMLAQMIPDALRGTNCNAMSLWGDKTVSGERITARALEWNLGSDRQMTSAHCVLHMKNGENSVTLISILGMLDVITAVNDNGVFAGILDVGSENNYICEGKICYTYDLRYALETYDNATDVGNYMVENSSCYTWSHNIILTDADHSYCIENCVDETVGKAVLRDNNTVIHEGLPKQSDGSLWVVNSFISIENKDNITTDLHNKVRYEKFYRWINEKEAFTLADVKAMLTSEDVDREMNNIYSTYLVHLVIVDYETGTLHAVFAEENGAVNNPEFIMLGSYR